MEDEHADRVYVPGTNPTPPDRDVEPLWDSDEVEAPVHGRPVPVPPHQAPPPVPVSGPQVGPPVYRPERPVPAPPPPAVPAPVTQIPAPRPPMAPPTPPPTQPWPNLERPAEQPPAAPTSGERPAEPVQAAPDSPWSQPPPARASASVSVPQAIRPVQQPPPPPPPPIPAPGPAPAQHSPAPEPANGAIYRPGAPMPPPPPPVQQQGPPPPPPGPYPPTMNPQAHPQAPPQQQPPGPPPVDPFQDLPWVSDGTPTAEEFARRRLAKPAEPTASMGARAILNKTALGLVKLAPGKREQEYKQDVEMVRRNFGGLRQVTVVNPKGGAGKTVAVLLLAMTFGQKRGGYVLAWDNNETQGTLGMRAQQDFHARTVRDMMRDLHLFRGAHGRVGDLSQYVRAQGEGMFDVLASDESAMSGEMLTAGAFAEIREIVSRFYKLIFVDTGNNVRAQNWQAAIDATDQLVITMSARNDSAETAARMLDHLEQSGRQRLVRQAISVVTMPPTRKDIDLPAIQRHFAARTRAVLMAPYEKLIDSGEPLRYGQLSANTKDAWLKIAAAVAEGL
ncbi:MinD/ParA family ATP-binding protein [Actinoplanes subtropicus]|uniref:MinD/ParA family ATP-binding protein n=1 Tax=Actinoplanes subtropicus TaxID=543632 RepID=UPI0004C449A9|nr:ParA family protein [Actinoplanes subtropicus]